MVVASCLHSCKGPATAREYPVAVGVEWGCLLCWEELRRRPEPLRVGTIAPNCMLCPHRPVPQALSTSPPPACTNTTPVVGARTPAKCLGDHPADRMLEAPLDLVPLFRPPSWNLQQRTELPT